MWPLWLLALLALPLVYFLRSVEAFYVNYKDAKKMGIPIVYSPISVWNPIWLILAPVLAPMIRKLPFGLGDWVHYTTSMWLWDDQDEMHSRLGKAFVHVNPGQLMVYVADVGAIRHIYARKKVFERDHDEEKMPTLLTPSVSSVGGSEWQRHRRITAPPFNESNMKLVWHESLRQAQSASQWWHSRGEGGFKSACKDTMAIALNALAYAGLGLSWEFRSPDQPRKQQDFAAEYRENLAPLLTDIIVLALTPRWLYKYGPNFTWLLPNTLADHVVKAKNFRGLISRLMEERRVEIKTGKAKDNIFLNAIIAKSEEMQQELRLGAAEKGADSISSSLGGLSEDELFANFFDYAIAGHETTAHTMNYCLHVLAVEPQWQEWIQEEVDTVWPELPVDPETTDYEETFYKLKRCLVLMFETLRLFPPVVMHQKTCLADEGHELPVEDKTLFIPSKALLRLSCLSVHLLPEYWGPDSHEFKPARWIQSRDGSGSTNDSLAEALDAEQIAPPPVAKETFFPWSMGARDCPGKKFAQVEFVAVMAYLFRHYRVEAVPLDGETFQETRRRIWAYTRDSVSQVTINFREPDKYPLRLVKRIGL